MEKYGGARHATYDNIIRRMRIACWTSKATNTHSEYVIPIAFSRQQLFGECASLLRCTYIASVVAIKALRLGGILYGADTFISPSCKFI